MQSYFIAIEIPESFQKQLSSLCYGLSSFQWQEPDNFQIILLHLGFLNDPLLFSVQDALTSISFPPFQIELSGVDYSCSKKGRDGYLWVGIKPIEQVLKLKRKIELGLKHLNIVSHERSVDPHIVLGHEIFKSNDKLIDYLKENSLFRSGSFEVKEFSLSYTQKTAKRILHHRFPIILQNKQDN